jgi:adenylate cyclase
MRTENLAIVFIDIAGFASRTSSQTREENRRLLRRFDGAVRPLVRAYNGRVVKTIGDAYLLTFRSPTDALLCSTAVHDRLAVTDLEVAPAERFLVRAAVNVGDVRIKGGDVFGEAVNIASRIEGKTGAGEVYFSESVYLSMTRTEVPCEEVGYVELKGIPGQVRLYRVPKANEAAGHAPQHAGKGSKDLVNLPFAGLGLGRVRNKLSLVLPMRVLSPAMSHAQGFLSITLRQGIASLSRFFGWWREEVRRSRAVQYGTMIVLMGLIWLMYWALKPRPSTPWRKLQRALGL